MGKLKVYIKYSRKDYILVRYGRKKRRKIIAYIITFVFIFISLFILYEMYDSISIEETENGYEAKRISNENNDLESQSSVSNMIQDISTCIVGISKIKDTGSTVFLQDGTTKLGLGSGVIVSTEGYVLTNEHVSGSKYSKCYLTLDSGTTYEGSVVWSDTDLDLAIVKIPIKGIRCAQIGNSKNVRIGDTVYAIGNPIGVEFQRTVTSGIISGLDRIIKFEENGKTVYMNNLIQTDASINPGNSGGPLIDTEGNVIGINSVKITSAEGISFAVPINCVKTIIERFEKDGKFEEASIGIFAYDSNVSKYLNPKLEAVDGIYVEQIQDTLAKNTDLKIGDIITMIDSIKLTNMCDLRNYIYSKNPGDEVSLQVLRGNTNLTINVKLKKK